MKRISKFFIVMFISFFCLVSTTGLSQEFKQYECDSSLKHELEKALVGRFVYEYSVVGDSIVDFSEESFFIHKMKFQVRSEKSVLTEENNFLNTLVCDIKTTGQRTQQTFPRGFKYTSQNNSKKCHIEIVFMTQETHGIKFANFFIVELNNDSLIIYDERMYMINDILYSPEKHVYKRK